MTTFTHDNQPYGAVTFTVESVQPVLPPEKRCIGDSYLFNRAAADWVELTGTVVKGSVTSRLFHASSTRDLAGTKYTVQVPPEAYEKGRYVSVAM